VGGTEDLLLAVSACCFQLAAHSVEPRLPSLREGEKGEGDKVGENIVEKLMVVVRSQEGLLGGGSMYISSGWLDRYL
jgi:hypothetical protein